MAVDLQTSTLAVVLFLGPACIMWVVVEAMHRMRRKMNESLLSLLRNAVILTCVLVIVYYCEYCFYAKENKKVVRPYMYWGLFGLLLFLNLFTLRKTDSTEFMNREQTEEWKGWMQFLFLQYHYWAMEGAYKDIRVFITCYLWMTGFGNFSFFYMKSDYSLLRGLQMIWRMNFFVFFLCLTMNNPYIVYYICPLHTFYFLVTYFTMGVWNKVNHTEYGAGAKCFVALLLLFLVFDCIPRAFHGIFAWLGTTPTGASIGNHGVEWEWYFRSYLDHFSTVWGMVFALNMPFLAQWFKRVESFSVQREWGIKLAVFAGLFVMMVFWVREVYHRPKSAYNQVHSYYSIVPLITYLFLRNISKTVRSYYFHGLHWFGTITLESYLLQYHVWLADNAGKLLNIVPGQWLLSFIIASCLHIFLAVQVFNVTNKLRSICLPNDIGQSLRNLSAILGGMLVSFLIAHAFQGSHLGGEHLVWLIGVPSVLLLGFLEFTSERPVEEGKDGKTRGVVAAISKSHNYMPLKVTYGVVAVVALVLINRLLINIRTHHPIVNMRTGHFDHVLSAGNTTSLLSLHANRDVFAPLHDGDGTIGEADFDALLLADQFELQDSYSFGRLFGFVVGSLAQTWHGLVAFLMIVLSIVTHDSFFGLGRLALYFGAPAGQKTITWEEAYGPLLRKIGIRPKDAEEGAAATERTPLATATRGPATGAGATQ